MVQGIFGLLKGMPTVTELVETERDTRSLSMMLIKVLSFTGNKYFESNNS